MDRHSIANVLGIVRHGRDVPSREHALSDHAEMEASIRLKIFGRAPNLGIEDIHINDLRGDKVINLLPVDRRLVREELEWRKHLVLDLAQRIFLLLKTVNLAILQHLPQLLVAKRQKHRIPRRWVDQEAIFARPIVRVVVSDVNGADTRLNHPPQRIFSDLSELKLPLRVVKSAPTDLRRRNICPLVAVGDDLHDRTGLNKLGQLRPRHSEGVVDDELGLFGGIALAHRPEWVPILELSKAGVPRGVVIAVDQRDTVPPRHLMAPPDLHTALTSLL